MYKILSQIAKVARASNVVSSYDDRVGIDFIKFRIGIYLSMMLIVAHWSACVYRLVPSIEGLDDEDSSWISVYFKAQPNEVDTFRLYNVGKWHSAFCN